MSTTQCATEWVDATCCPEDIEAAFVWQGEWIIGTTYAVNMAVESGGSTFVCIVAHTASADNLPDVENEGGDWEVVWDIMAKGGDAIEWQGTWVDGVYQSFDAVAHNGSSYIATVDVVLGEEPGVDDPPWDLMARAGRDVGFLYAMKTLANAVPGTTPPVAGTIETNDGSLDANTGIWVANLDGSAIPQDRSDALESWVTDNAADHGTLLLSTLGGDVLAEWTYTAVTSAATGYVGFTVAANALNATAIADGVPVHISVLQRGDAGIDGADGADGAGDLTGPADSAADEVALFDGVTGTVLKRPSTGAAIQSKGTTAQRPTPVEGMFRYNLDTNVFEGYQGTTLAWSNLSNELIPEEFGAIGDGIVDDATALQAWLDAIPGSGTFGRLPAKVYRTGTTLVVPDNSSIIGDPGSGDGLSGGVIRTAGVAALGTIIQCGPTAGTGVESVYIDNLIIDGLSANSGIKAGFVGRNLQDSTLKNIRIFNCAGVGMQTETDVTQAEGTAFNQRNFIFNVLCNNNVGKGMYFIGEKDTRFDNLHSRNNSGDGIHWQASASSAAGATSETTQCVVGQALSRGNGGHGFILDGVEKYNMGVLTATVNTLTGLEFRTTNKQATGSVGLNSAAIGGLVLRKNKGGGINMVTGARVSGLQIGAARIIGGDIDPGNDPELLRDIDGIVFRAAAKVHFDSCQISLYGGNAIVLREDTPIDAVGAEQCRDIRIDDAEFFGNGNPLSGSANGIRILNSTTRFSIGSFRSNNNDTSGGSYELNDAGGGASEINIAESSTVSESGSNAVNDPGGAVTIYGRDVREGVPQGVGTAPTITALLSGAATYTVPDGVLYLRVKLVGGGGGAAGSASGGGLTNGSAGVATTFGTALLTGNPGAGGVAATDNGGGAGGTATGGDLNVRGSNGGGSLTAADELNRGGFGGVGPLGGAGAAGAGADPDSPANLRGAAAANSGSGGSGGGGDVDIANGGSGGGAGGYVEKLISNPDATYAYVVGGGGAGGGRGQTAPDIGVPGGVGGSGFIIVEEFYS